MSRWVQGLAVSLALLVTSACGTSRETEGALPSVARPPTALTASANTVVASAAASISGALPMASRAPCPDTELDFEPTREFEHRRSKLIASAEPHHYAVDALAKLGGPATLRAKFSYGPTSKDLEDETVVFFLEGKGCKVAEVGRATTDGDGWARLEVPSSKLLVGEQRFTAVVAADGSRSKASLHVVQPGTKAVVFDVDATLTTSDREIFEEVLKGYVPEMRPDGPKVVKAYADAGYFIGYITGRPYLLLRNTKGWLADKGFSPGYVRVTDRTHQALPTGAGVEAYKLSALEELKAAGLVLAHAYGNATTDIAAYARAGFPTNRTFILGPYAGQACEGFDKTVALDSYSAQLPLLPGLFGP